MMKLLRVIECINEWTGKCVSIFIILLVFVIVVGVGARYLFDSPIIWIHETSLFIYGTYFMLAGGYTLLNNRHVKVEIIHKFLPERKRAILDLITAPIFFFYIILMLWVGTEMTVESWRVREVNATFWAPVIYPFKAVIPIGAFLLLMQGFVKLVRDVKVLKQKSQRLK